MPFLSPAGCSSLESLESPCIKAFCGVLRSFALLLISEDFVSSLLGTGDRGIFVYGFCGGDSGGSGGGGGGDGGGGGGACGVVRGLCCGVCV